MLRCRTVLLIFAMMAVTSIGAVAQQATTPPPQPDQVLLKPEQLEALVAPIALYPDELLANVLAASTYPLEVVQADRWLKERKSLKGEALKKEVDKQAWDDSVKALASTPDVIALMNDKLDWTKDLGDAVLAQQPDVMDAIQRLRTKAYDNKKLVTTKQQKVSVQTQENRQAVVIEPADPETMYVPYYEPAAVYGDWPYAEYPAVLFRLPLLYRRRRDRGGSGLRRRLGDRTLGKLLGRRMQLGQPQPLHQPLQQDQQHRKQLAAQSGAPPGRALQQCQRPAEIRQQQPAVGRCRPDGSSRPRRPERSRRGKGPCGRRRSRQGR